MKFVRLFALRDTARARGGKLRNFTVYTAALNDLIILKRRHLTRRVHVNLMVNLGLLRSMNIAVRASGFEDKRLRSNAKNVM